VPRSKSLETKRFSEPALRHAAAGQTMGKGFNRALPSKTRAIFGIQTGKMADTRQGRRELAKSLPVKNKF
jgi:hypothetical protein